jgi:hypothetical protein
MILPGGNLTKPGKLSSLAIIALTLVPPIILVANVTEYNVDVPFWDQWNFVPLLGKSYEGSVTIGDLWGQHNEHRLLFPRLIMLGLAHASRYNIVWELAVIVVLAAATFVLLWRQFAGGLKVLGYRGLPWVLPIISLLVFTLGQAENWLWGWQIQIFLNVLAAVSGFILLSGHSFRWGRFWWALGFGVLATYSFANGLLFWPLGLSLSSHPTKNKGIAFVRLGGSTAIVAFPTFPVRFESPSGTPWTQFLEPGDTSVRLKYLGRPVINYEPYALAIGLVGLLLFSFVSCSGACARNLAIRPSFLRPLLIGCSLSRESAGSGLAAPRP